jgi:hypothetical protein
MDVDSATLDLTPFIVGTVAFFAAAGALMYLKVKRDKIRYALTREGESVRLLVHSEAPEDAGLLGDIHTEILSSLDYVKNDLRNRTARLGGDLVVLDDIQQDVFEGETRGYVGIGRAYRAGGRSIRRS